MLFDSHCHLDFPAFDADRDAVVQSCREAGLVGIVVPGVTAATWPRLLEVVSGAPGFLHPALGLQPMFLDAHRDADLDALRAGIEAHRPIAVGEIGLDYYDKGLDRARQRALSRAQLAIAREADLPVILHVRKAHEEVLALLREVRVCGGVAHAFNGSPQLAARYLEFGFKLGIGGGMTHERARKLRATVRDLPAEAIVLETDAPDMAPAGHRGERNSPAYLPEVLAALSALRGEAPDDLARVSTENVRKVFRLT